MLARVLLGGVSIWDFVVLAAILAVHPLTEWLIHVYLLHFRPRDIGPIRMDFRLARDHRSHHQAPHDPKYWFIPIQSGIKGAVVTLGIGLVLFPAALAVTGLIGVLAVGLVYEWTHYLCHTTYRPRGAWFQQRVRHHRLHHHKNERYWMGVTLHAADDWLGTNPDPRDVKTSPTCSTLG